MRRLDGCGARRTRVCGVPRVRGTIPAEAFDEVAAGSYVLSVRTVGLKVLKNKLSEYVRLAAQGETVLIADGERVVAELVPPQEGRSTVLADAVLAGLVREGLLTPPLAGSGTPARPPPVARCDDLARELDAGRADR